MKCDALLAIDAPGQRRPEPASAVRIPKRKK